MTEPNYESKWWGYIYDQMMENLSDLVEANHRFYHSNLAQVTGPILECACGTGIFLLPLLEAGHNMVGFDISKSMLAALRIKAEAQGMSDIADRISVQELETFSYPQRFDAIIIPSHTFSVLTTQEAQIKTLQNIYAHLAPDGKLLLNIRLVGLKGLVEAPAIQQGRWHTWTHPQTGRPIRQRRDGRLDFNKQLILDHCFIEYEGQQEEFPMSERWIFRDEFQLLLRLAGFKDWEVFSTPERDPLRIGLEETHSYWIAYKNS